MGSHASERERSEESHADGPVSEAPSSGIREARLVVPRPRPRALPGKEVLPAPGVPETPRRERNMTSSFWPAPPEPMKVARPSKRGTPLTTRPLGFPEATLRAGAPAARKSSPPRPRPVDSKVEAKIDVAADLHVASTLDRVPPPPPRSKRKHTDQGWPPPGVGALEEGSRIDARAAEPVPEPVVAVSVAVAVSVSESDAQPIAADVALAPLFGGDDEEIELPFRQGSARVRWIVALVAVALAVIALAAFAR